jgi:outer membrane lipoprotein-sorting protein
MARIRPTQVADDGFWDDPPSRRGKAVRYGVPVAVAGVAAATIGLVPALAATGAPDLPKVSAQELISKMAASDTEQLSGTVEITSDLGIPGLSTGASALVGQAGGGSAGGGSSAAPEAKLTELASGTHTLRVTADGPEKQRVSIMENAAEYSVIHNGDQVWAYDSASNSVYHATAPADAAHDTPKGSAQGAPKNLPDLTPQEFAKKALAAVDSTTSVKVGGTEKVAGRNAYQLVIEPKQADSTIGSVRIAVDADNGVPLKFTVTPKGSSKAAVDAAFTTVDFGKPSASSFDFTPPKGAKVTEGSGARHQTEGKHSAQGLSGLTTIGNGWDSVARLDLPGGISGKAGSGAGAGRDSSSPDSAAAGQFLDSLGTKVKGGFGSGTVISSRLVNALVTDDGKVFVGAVDKGALVKAADAAK